MHCKIGISRIFLPFVFRIWECWIYAGGLKISNKCRVSFLGRIATHCSNWWDKSSRQFMQVFESLPQCLLPEVTCHTVIGSSDLRHPVHHVMNFSHWTAADSLDNIQSSWWNKALPCRPQFSEISQESDKDVSTDTEGSDACDTGESSDLVSLLTCFYSQNCLLGLDIRR